MRSFDRSDLQMSAISRRRALMLLGATALAGCTPTTNPLPPSQTLPPPTTGTGLLPSGNVLGTGTVRVGLLLPTTGPGNGPALSTALRNAVQLGLNDFPGNDLTVLVKDTQSTVEGSTAAATAAITEGAEILLGPIFATEARAAGLVAAQSGRSVISFSSDPSATSSNVIVMGFMVDDQVNQMVAHAAANGRKSMAALIGDNAYGLLAEATLRQATSQRGIRLVQVERYTAADQAAKTAAVAANASQIDSVFIPDAPVTAGQIAQGLRGAGVDFNRVMLIGSGQWYDPSAYGIQALVGGRFPAPEMTGFQTFSARYQQAFGSAPLLMASLAYDATVLAAGLVRAAGAQRFQRQILTNPEGFLSSVNGLFRFNPDGTNDRGQAVYEMTGLAPRLLTPAPRSFSMAG